MEYFSFEELKEIKAKVLHLHSVYINLSKVSFKISFCCLQLMKWK